MEKHCKFDSKIFVENPRNGKMIMRQILCEEHIGCEKCGWNPDVERERKKILMAQGPLALVDD